MAISLLHANDKKGEHAPSWYAATANHDLSFEPLKGNATCDVAIIGGGYSGLSSALHLSERGYKVRLLDAHRMGWGASGRNGGQVASGQRLDQVTLEKLVGVQHAHAAFKIGVDAASLVRDLIDRHDIACDYREGVIEANHKAKFDAEAKAYVAKMNDEYDYHAIRHITPEEMAEKVGSPDYSGGLVDTASGHLHPLNYALGLALAAQKAGAILHDLSEVISLKKQAGKWHVKTAGGGLTSETVILACNGYQGHLERNSAARVMPINNFIIATEPLDHALAKSLIRDGEAVADSRYVVNYFRLSRDNRLLFGGGENYGYRFPGDIKAFVRKPMLKVFPQLEGTKIAYGWGGTLGITVHRVPNFSFEDGLLTISGYSGSGVAMATMAGKIAAEAIGGTMERFDVMAKLPTPKFPGGAMLRWPTLVAAMTFFALKDRL